MFKYLEGGISTIYSGKFANLVIKIYVLSLISYRIKYLLDKNKSSVFKNLNFLGILIYSYSLALYSSPYKVSLIIFLIRPSRTNSLFRSLATTFFITILNSSLK